MTEDIKDIYLFRVCLFADLLYPQKNVDRFGGNFAGGDRYSLRDSGEQCGGVVGDIRRDSSLRYFSPFGIAASALYILTPYLCVCGISLAVFARVRGQEEAYI